MKLIIIAAIFLMFFIAASLAGFIEIAAAPEIDFFAKSANNSKPRVHPVKYIYDRIGPEFEAFRQPRCKTPGTIWYHDACWRPERIPRNAEK